MKKSYIIVFSLIAALLIVLPFASAAAQDIISRVLRPFEGLELSTIYDKHHFIIDFIIVFIIFQSVAYLTLGKRFEGPPGKAMSVAVAVALTFGAVLFMNSRGFTLKNFGPVGIIILVVVFALMLFEFLRGLGAGIPSAIAAAFLLVYFVMLAVAPFAFDWLREKADIVDSLLQLLVLVCFVIVIVDVIKLFRHVGGGGGSIVGGISPFGKREPEIPGMEKEARRERGEAEKERKAAEKEEHIERDLEAVNEHDEKLRNLEEAYRGVRRKYTHKEAEELQELANFMRELHNNVREIEELQKQVKNPEAKERIRKLLERYKSLVASINIDLNKIMDYLLKQKGTLRKNIREAIRERRDVIKKKHLAAKIKELDTKDFRNKAEKKGLKKELEEIKRLLKEFDEVENEEIRGEKKEKGIFIEERREIADQIKRIEKLQKSTKSAEIRVLPSKKIEGIYNELNAIYEENKDVWGKERIEERYNEIQKQLTQRAREILRRVEALIKNISSKKRKQASQQPGLPGMNP